VASDHRTPTQDEYEAATSDTRWVELEDFDGEVQVREVPPLRLLRGMEEHGVDGMLTDDVEMDQVLADGDLSGFIEDVVLPNVVQPTCRWGSTGDGDFDLTALTPTDLMTVISGLTGQDPSDLGDDVEDRFRG